MRITAPLILLKRLLQFSLVRKRTDPTEAKMTVSNNRSKRHLLLFLVISVFLILGLVTYRCLFLPGHVIIGDFTHVENIRTFMHNGLFYTWNAQAGRSNIYQLSKNLIYTPLILFGNSVSYTTAVLSLLLLLSVVCGYTMFLLTRSLLKIKGWSITENIIPLCSALVYRLAPFTVTEASHTAVKFGYYLTPLIVLLLLKGLARRKPTYLILCALVWSLAASGMHWVIYEGIVIALTVIGWLCYETITKNKRIMQTMGYTGKYFALVVGLFLIFNAYWLIPGILSGGTSLYPNILTKEGSLNLFRNGDLLNTLALKGGFEDQRYWNPGTSTTISTAALLILTIIALLTLLWKRNSLRRSFLALLALFAVCLGVGPRLAPQFYYWLQFQAPGHFIWGWSLRTPKINFLVSFSIALLLATSGMRMADAVAKKIPCALGIFRGVFLIVILGLIGIGSHPFIVGTFNGNLQPVKLPAEFNETATWIKEQTENCMDCKVLWGPPYGGWAADWHPYSIGDLTEGITPRPTFADNSFLKTLSWPLLFGRPPYFESLVYHSEVKNLSDFLSPLSIAALVIHDDIGRHNGTAAAIIDNLESTDLTFAWREGFISAFTVPDYAPIISSRGSLISTSGGLRVYNSLTYLNTFEPHKEQALVYTDQLFDDYEVDQASVFVTNHDVTDFIMQATEDKLVLVPFACTDRYSPPDAWSKASMTDLGFRGYLSDWGILDQYQFGFSKGVVFTFGAASLSNKVNPTEEDLMVDWEFDEESSLNSWKGIEGNEQSGIHELRWEDGYLVNELLVATGGWKVIKGPLIPISYPGIYRIAIRLKALNISQLHIKAEEVDSSQSILEAKQVVGLGSGCFNWKKVVVDYSPNHPECRYLRLSIWHGHETPQPLPNTLSIDYMKVYDMDKYSRPVSLDVPFTMNREAEFNVFIRCLESNKGGAIRLHLDGRSALVATDGYLNRFIWKDLGIWNLTTGKQIITVENVQGFNALNVLVLLPSSEYTQAEKQFEDLLNNANIIYSLEAETDLRLGNEEHDVVSCPGASNGRILRLGEQQETQQQLEILGGGDYGVAVVGQGTFAVAIDDHIERVNTDTLQTTYLPPTHLGSGKHQLQVTSLADDSRLDIIWLYSTNGTETLDDILTNDEDMPKIIGHREINPTKHEVHVETRKSFMLSFAEAYDPCWVAEVKTPTAVKQYSPVPLYGLINGFWLEETGEYTVTIRYKPQRWFCYGVISSVLSLLGAMGYLVWDWRKRRARS